MSWFCRSCESSCKWLLTSLLLNTSRGKETPKPPHGLAFTAQTRQAVRRVQRCNVRAQAAATAAKPATPGTAHNNGGGTKVMIIGEPLIPWTSSFSLLCAPCFVWRGLGEGHHAFLHGRQLDP